MSKKNTIIVVAYPDLGAGNDPEPFFFFFSGGECFNAKAQHFYSGQYMRVMICLGQGGLRSLSASSLCCIVNFTPVEQSLLNTNEEMFTELLN